MHVHGLDHINIRTGDIAKSARFYAELLGLEPRTAGAAASLSIDQACWLVDPQGQAIIHLFRADSRTGDTGPIHHIALHCSGKPAMIARLQQLGLTFDMREVANTLTQICVRDPHGILLELTFPGE